MISRILKMEVSYFAYCIAIFLLIPACVVFTLDPAQKTGKTLLLISAIANITLAIFNFIELNSATKAIKNNDVTIFTACSPQGTTKLYVSTKPFMNMGLGYNRKKGVEYYETDAIDNDGSVLGCEETSDNVPMLEVIEASREGDVVTEEKEPQATQEKEDISSNEIKEKGNNE